MKKYDLKTEGGPDVNEMNSDPLMSLDFKAKKLLSELLASADEDIMQKVDDLVSKICQSVRQLDNIILLTFFTSIINHLCRYVLTFKVLSARL